MPQTVQARRLLHQRSPRQPPCLHSLPVTSTSCVPVPASACAAHCRALPARSGLGGRPPCASGAPRQRLTPDSNCRALRPAGPIALAPGRARRAVASSTGPRSFAVCGAPRSGPTEFHSRLRVDWRAGSRCHVPRSSFPLPQSCRVRGRFAAGQTGGASRAVGVISRRSGPLACRN